MQRIFHHILHHKKRYSILLIILLIVGYFLWPKGSKPIATQKVVRANITQSLSETGTIDAKNEVNLSFLAAGKLASLSVQKGDRIKQGQVIAVLDQRTMQKNLETALRNYSEQRNTFDQTIDNNQGRTPEGALNDAMKRILQDNQYDLDKAVLSVELQDLAKQQSVLTSPIDGIVTREDVTSPGVNVSATNIFGVADPNSMIFKIDVDEADIGKIRDGEKVSVVLDPYPDKTLTLMVDSIDFTTHSTSTGGNAYTVEAKLPPNNDLNYRIGMNGDADIILDERHDVLTIPLSSISNDQYVYVKTPNGFEKRSISVGLTNDTTAEVRSGLQENDQVAIDPTQAEKLVNK